ncbi:hypothetical protein M1247_29590 [Mycobacterium sp. 21AC1]|uniref:hypothetical protein n=1 Tax=[Mycobacterium] appelbergii TaxID=2939269 RepID=UPI002938DF55|nr:hypothetical protein [Mycobacterium sp. 21AC1]MDV3129091.1 hypothetical protein [Mycobacterium sp. 21AC1]
MTELHIDDPRTGAWSSLPWPADPNEKHHLIANSLGPLLIRWAEGNLSDEESAHGLINPVTGESWKFTDDQKRALILALAYSPEDGKPLFGL